MKKRTPKPKRASRTSRIPPSAYHPARKEHAEQFVQSLEDKKSRDYAQKVLDHIWWGKSKVPSAPRGMKAGRTKEITAALYAAFATLR